MHQLFYRIYHWISTHRVWSVFFALVFLLMGAYFTTQLQLEDDITRVIPNSEKSDITTRVFQQQQFSDKITVIIERKNDASIEEMMQTADRLVDNLEQYRVYIKNIGGVADDELMIEAFEFVYHHLPIYLDEKDYQWIDSQLNTDSISVKMTQNFETLLSPSGVVLQDFILKDPLGLGFRALQKLQKIGSITDLQYRDGYIFTQDDSKLLLFIDPVYKSGDTKHNAAFVAGLTELQQALNAELHRTEISFFGAPIIAVANAQQIKTDIMKTVLIAMSILVLLLMLFYRQIFTPIIIFIPTIFGLLTALSVLYFLRDSLSAISLSIGAVLLGITIDYALHVMTHYRKNPSISQLFRDITRPVLMSCMTTAVAFICLIFVHSEALIDLGIFAFVTVIASGFFTLILVPHLYHPSKGEIKENRNIVEQIAKINFDEKKSWFWLSVVLVAMSFFTFDKVKFNQNIESLNFVPIDQIQAENQLVKSTNMMQKSVYVIAHGSNLDEAVERSQQLEKQLETNLKSKEILDYSSINALLLPKAIQEKKLDDWKRFWTPEKIARTQQLIRLSADELGLTAEAHEEFFQQLAHDFEAVSLDEIQAFNSSILSEFFNEKDGLFTVSTLVKLDEQQRNSFVSQYDNAEGLVIIDRKNLNETFLGNLVDDFNRLINYSTIAILLILWIFFRRIELALASFIPIALTGFVTAGLMGLFKIEFNIFSSIVYTLVLGHGVDFSIFMTSALQKQYTTGRNEQKLYRTSILLAVLTTILALGSLIFAQHPALKSISSVALIGVLVAVMITFVFYPPLFKFFFQNRPAKGLSPVSLRLVIQSVAFFAYFLFFGFVLNILIVLFNALAPISHIRKRKIIDRWMTGFLATIPYINPFVKKKILHLDKRNSTQTVFISNHSSSLDIPLNKMAIPNSVFLVNNKVYHSPVFGKAVRSAGFYPVKKNEEVEFETFKQRIQPHFSLIIYPEGTRSESNAIARFHKGAFYLAEKLNIPIQPVYLLGASDVWPKNDYIIYDGHLLTIFGEVIEPNDERFGKGYAVRTKKISDEFKKQFSALRKQYENENYYRTKLFLSFLYKEPEVVTEMKKRFEQNKTVYHQLNRLIGEREKIGRIAHDLGELDFLLAMSEPNRKIKTYISDDEKRAIASMNYLVKKRSISYLDEQDDFADCRVLIISDVKYDAEIHPNIEEVFVFDATVPSTVLENYEKIHQLGKLIQYKKR